tara:strand:- start:359 stop:550 length:192 start_codon:yes stop_codon:yes gene_type:complete
MDRKVTMETLEKMKQPKTVEHKQKISITQYKRSYDRYLLEVTKPNLSFQEFVEARKKGYKWQY